MSTSAKWIVGLIVIILIAVGVVRATRKTSDSDSVKLGVITFTTGPLAALGEEEVYGLNMASDEINAAGGIKGKKFESFVEDYAYDPKRAPSAYEALRTKGINFFTVEGSGGTGAVVPLVRQQKTWSMVAGAVIPSYADGNPLTCRIALRANIYGPALANFILSRHPKAHVAFFVSANEYGKAVQDEVTKVITAAGGAVTVAEDYQQASGSDYRTQIAKLKTAEATTDALVVINAGNTIEPMFEQLREQKYGKEIMTDMWTGGNPQLKTKSLVEGVYYVDYALPIQPDPSDSAEAKAFKEKFFKLAGRYPSAAAVNTYDAIHIFAQAANGASELTPTAVSDYIIHTMGSYKGIGGEVKFDDDCEVTRASVIRQFKNGVPVLIQ